MQIQLHFFIPIFTSFMQITLSEGRLEMCSLDKYFYVSAKLPLVLNLQLTSCVTLYSSPLYGTLALNLLTHSVNVLFGGTFCKKRTWRLSASSSTGKCKGPSLKPRSVGSMVTCTSRFPDALTLSSKDANSASLE